MQIYSLCLASLNNSKSEMVGVLTKTRTTIIYTWQKRFKFVAAPEKPVIINLLGTIHTTSK